MPFKNESKLKAVLNMQKTQKLKELATAAVINQLQEKLWKSSERKYHTEIQWNEEIQNGNYVGKCKRLFSLFKSL